MREKSQAQDLSLTKEAGDLEEDEYSHLVTQERNLVTPVPKLFDHFETGMWELYY